MTVCQQSGRLAGMSEITMKEITNDDLVQEAELRIPIEKLAAGIRRQDDVTLHAAVVNALAFIAEVKRLAFEHLDVDDDNADYTSFEYKGLDGDVLVVRVAQVNV